MKKSKYITILLASLFLCINTYAQNAESAQGQSVSQNAQSAKATTTTTTTYSSEKGSITITSKPTETGVSHSISAKVPAGQSISLEELVKSVSNAMSKDENTSEADKATMLAISQMIGALVEKGELPAIVANDFSMEMNTAADATNPTTSNTGLSVSAEGKTVSAQLQTAPASNGSYTVSGTTGDSQVNINVQPTADSYVVSGDVAGQDVKTTVSNQDDASLSLESATVATDDGNGNVTTKTVENNPDGTYTVTETSPTGETTSNTYEGTTESPYASTPTPVAGSSTNVDNLGGIGDETVSKDPTSSDAATEEVEVPDTTIVVPEVYATPETITE